MYRRFLSIILAFNLLFLLSACSKQNTGSKKPLYAWVLSEDYSDCLSWIEKNYCSDFDWKLDISVVDSSDLLQLLDNSEKCPDVLMVSPEKIKPLALKKYIIPLADAGFVIERDKYYDFAVNTGIVNNKLYAMCFHSSPGVYVYRRSISKAYLGTDEPTQIESLISDWESFYDVSQLISVSSGQKSYISAGAGDIARTYFGGDFTDPSQSDIEGYFDLIKKLHDNNLIYGAEQWSEAWIEGFNDENSIFSYFLSGIGIDDVLFSVSRESRGDWAAAVPFSPYSWGGVYLGICSESSNKAEAAELIGILTKNEAAMKELALYNGIFTANRSVNRNISSDAEFESSVLGGQNYFDILIRSAETIDNNSVQSSIDSPTITLLGSCAEKYINGTYDMETAVEVFFSSYNSLQE